MTSMGPNQAPALPACGTAAAARLSFLFGAQCRPNVRSTWRAQLSVLSPCFNASLEQLHSTFTIPFSYRYHCLFCSGFSLHAASVVLIRARFPRPPPPPPPQRSALEHVKSPHDSEDDMLLAPQAASNASPLLLPRGLSDSPPFGAASSSSSCTESSSSSSSTCSSFSATATSRVDSTPPFHSLSVSLLDLPPLSPALGGSAGVGSAASAHLASVDLTLSPPAASQSATSSASSVSETSAHVKAEDGGRIDYPSSSSGGKAAAGGGGDSIDLTAMDDVSIDLTKESSEIWIGSIRCTPHLVPTYFCPRVFSVFSYRRLTFFSYLFVDCRRRRLRSLPSVAMTGTRISNVPWEAGDTMRLQLHVPQEVLYRHATVWMVLNQSGQPVH
jgi:hypothetical protein